MVLPSLRVPYLLIEKDLRCRFSLAPPRNKMLFLQQGKDRTTTNDRDSHHRGNHRNFDPDVRLLVPLYLPADVAYQNCPGLFGFAGDRQSTELHGSTADAS